MPALDAILLAARRLRVAVRVDNTGIALMFWPTPLHSHDAEGLLVKLQGRLALEVN